MVECTGRVNNIMALFAEYACGDSQECNCQTSTCMYAVLDHGSKLHDIVNTVLNSTSELNYPQLMIGTSATAPLGSRLPRVGGLVSNGTDFPVHQFRSARTGPAQRTQPTFRLAGQRQRHTLCTRRCRAAARRACRATGNMRKHAVSAFRCCSALFDNAVLVGLDQPLSTHCGAHARAV